MPVSTDNTPAITILTAYAKVRTNGELARVRLIAPDGAIEYEATHYARTARADVSEWAARSGVSVAFSQSFPA